MKLIQDGKEQRLLRSRELISRFGITGDESSLDEVGTMALRDAKRADLRLVRVCTQSEPPK